MTENTHHETPDVAELRRLRDTEREELHSPTRRLDAYYYSFNETGSVPIDAILSAVAIAGKSCHNTDRWTEDDEWSRWGVGRSLVDVIQCAAYEAAAALLDAAAERDALTVAQPCVMRMGEVYDFAWCETHDRTFALGSSCDHAGLSHVDYLDDDGREQRGRAVRAEMEMERIASERDALAAKVERVRALPAKHPAGGWYMTSMRDVLAALDEEPQP